MRLCCAKSPLKASAAGFPVIKAPSRRLLSPWIACAKVYPVSRHFGERSPLTAVHRGVILWLTNQKSARTEPRRRGRFAHIDRWPECDGAPVADCANIAAAGTPQDSKNRTMSALRDPRLELFARELAAALNNGVPAGEAAVQAGDAARYPRGRSAKTFAANCRKRAQRADVGKRVAEVRAPGIERAEQSIGITAEYLLAKLDNLSNFNIEDYLGAPDENGERAYTLVGLPRAVLGRLAVAKIGRIARGRGRKRKVTNFVADVGGHDPIAAVKLMAQIKGLMAPEKRDLTVHATDQMTDDELARIAAGGGAGAAATPGNP